MNIGIIPAAGKAVRFGGILKELLPAQDGISFINHAANKLRGICDFIIVVTNTEKIQNHMQDLKDVVFIEQANNLNLLGAVQTALQIKAERYYFTMPDTFTDQNIFAGISLHEYLTIGIFKTAKLLEDDKVSKTSQITVELPEEISLAKVGDTLRIDYKEGNRISLGFYNKRNR